MGKEMKYDEGMEMVMHNELGYATNGGVYGWMTARALGAMAAGAGLVVLGVVLVLSGFLGVEEETRKALGGYGAGVSSVGILFLIFSRPGRFEHMWITAGCVLLMTIHGLIPLAELGWRGIYSKREYSGFIWFSWSDFFWRWDMDWVEDMLNMPGGLAMRFAELGLLIAALFYLWNFARRAGRRWLQMIVPVYVGVTGLGVVFLGLATGVKTVQKMG
jgi:hypothetical protein